MPADALVAESEDTLSLVLVHSVSSATCLNTEMRTMVRLKGRQGAAFQAGKQQTLKQGSMKPGTSRWLGMLLECKERPGTIEAKTAKEAVNLDL